MTSLHINTGTNGKLAQLPAILANSPNMPDRD
jgi:hypothetical protein